MNTILHLVIHSHIHRPGTITHHQHHPLRSLTEGIRHHRHLVRNTKDIKGISLKVTHHLHRVLVSLLNTTIITMNITITKTILMAVPRFYEDA